MLDTLRADGLSAYGNPRSTSPAIDSLAARGVLFESVVAYETWTLPSLTTLLSGTIPTADIFDGKLRISLVERLREAGWKTAAFTEGIWFSRLYGLDRGFEDFWNPPILRRLARNPGKPPTDIAETFAHARSWIARQGDRPFFLAIHTYEPHAPYSRMDFVRAEGIDSGRLEGPQPAALEPGSTTEPRLGEAELDYIRALYDGGVLACDREVKTLLDLLDRRGIADETVVAITSDHGEDLGERGRPGAHGHALYDELVLVPLIIMDPTSQYPVHPVATQVRTADTLHTILDLLGVRVPEDRYGRSLVPLMTGAEKGDRVAWSRVTANPLLGFHSRWAVRTGSHKLVVNEGAVASSNGPEVEYYDLGLDPLERENIADRKPGGRRELEVFLQESRRAIEATGPPVYTPGEPAPEVQEQMRALGYIE